MEISNQQYRGAPPARFGGRQPFSNQSPEDNFVQNYGNVGGFDAPGRDVPGRDPDVWPPPTAKPREQM